MTASMRRLAQTSFVALVLLSAGTARAVAVCGAIGESSPPGTFDFGDIVNEAGDLDGNSTAPETAPSGSIDFGDVINEAGDLDGSSTASETAPSGTTDFGDLINEAGDLDGSSTASETAPSGTTDFGDLINEAGDLDVNSTADEPAPPGSFDFGDLLTESGVPEECQLPVLDSHGVAMLAIALLAGGVLLGLRQSKQCQLGLS